MKKISSIAFLSILITPAATPLFATDDPAATVSPVPMTATDDPAATASPVSLTASDATSPILMNPLAPPPGDPTAVNAPSPVAADAKADLTAQLTALEAQQATMVLELAQEEKFYATSKATFADLAPYVSGATDYATALKRERLLADVPLTPDEKNLCDAITYPPLIASMLQDLEKRVQIFRTAVASMNQFLPLARQSLMAGDLENVSHIIDSITPGVASAQELIDKPGAMGGNVGFYVTSLQNAITYYLKVTTTQ